MNYVRNWDLDASPLFCADGARLDEGVRWVQRGGVPYAVRAVLGTSARLRGEYRPVLHCMKPDGRSVQLTPDEVTVAAGGCEGAAL